MPLLMSNRGGHMPPSKCAPAEFVNSIFLPLLKKGTRGAEGANTLQSMSRITINYSIFVCLPYISIVL